MSEKQNSEVRAPFTARDTVVAMCPAAGGGFMIVTAQGKLYRLSFDGKDLEKLWDEVPV